MINIKNVRHKDGEIFPYEFTRPMLKALESLVFGELDFNCLITEVDETKVTTRTFILNCTDDSTFIGPVEEMTLLVEAAYLYMQSNPDRHPAFKERLVETVMKVTQGVPLLITLGAGQIIGQARTKIVILSMIGECPERDEFAKLKTDQLFVLMCLIRLDGVSTKDALELANFHVPYRMTV